MTTMSPAASSVWEVFLLFLTPFGGGIPAGVILAQSRGVDWQMMMILYFISDVVLACMFEPILWIILFASRRYPPLARFLAAMKQSMDKMVAKYGANPGPLTLVMISFGVDPMTGRTAARAAGHGFITGWGVAIAGDMIFFVILMVSSLWLNNILGNGTVTAVIIMLAMILLPNLFRRLRKMWKAPGT